MADRGRVVLSVTHAIRMHPSPTIQPSIIPSLNVHPITRISGCSDVFCFMTAARFTVSNGVRLHTAHNALY